MDRCFPPEIGSPADSFRSAAAGLRASIHALEAHWRILGGISFEAKASGGAWTTSHASAFRLHSSPSAHERLEAEALLDSCEKHLAALIGGLDPKPCSRIGLNFTISFTVGGSSPQIPLHIAAKAWGRPSRGIVVLDSTPTTFSAAQEFLDALGADPFQPTAGVSEDAMTTATHEILGVSHRTRLSLDVESPRIGEGEAARNALRQILFLTFLCDGSVDIDKVGIGGFEIRPAGRDELISAAGFGLRGVLDEMERRRISEECP